MIAGAGRLSQEQVNVGRVAQFAELRQGPGEESEREVGVVARELLADGASKVGCGEPSALAGAGGKHGRERQCHAQGGDDGHRLGELGPVVPSLNGHQPLPPDAGQFSQAPLRKTTLESHRADRSARVVGVSGNGHGPASCRRTATGCADDESAMGVGSLHERVVIEDQARGSGVRPRRDESGFARR